MSDMHKNNTPDRIEKALQPARAARILRQFPFGTDFTDTEQRLIPAMEILKQKSYSKKALMRLFLQGLTAKKLSSIEEACLERMELKRPVTVKEYCYQKVLVAALRETRSQ